MHRLAAQFRFSAKPLLVAAALFQIVACTGDIHAPTPAAPPVAAVNIDHRSDYQSGSSSPVIWRSSPVATGQRADLLAQCDQAFSPAVTSSRLRAPAFNGIDSCSFLFPPIANQLDAIVLMRNLAAARQISAPFRSLEHFPVTSVN